MGSVDTWGRLIHGVDMSRGELIHAAKPLPGGGEWCVRSGTPGGSVALAGLEGSRPPPPLRRGLWTDITGLVAVFG